MRKRSGWRTSVSMSLLVVLLLVWTSAAEGQAGPETEIPALPAPTLAEIEFYLDRIDTLEVDLMQCRELLADAEDPDCEGTSFWTLVIAAGIGGLLVAVVD